MRQWIIPPIVIPILMVIGFVGFISLRAFL